LENDLPAKITTSHTVFSGYQPHQCLEEVAPVDSNNPSIFYNDNDLWVPCMAKEKAHNPTSLVFFLPQIMSDFWLFE